MLDEVDTLHVERNTLSGDELLSYIGYKKLMNHTNHAQHSTLQRRQPPYTLKFILCNCGD
jgi:hypothetical protein